MKFVLSFLVVLHELLTGKIKWSDYRKLGKPIFREPRAFELLVQNRDKRALAMKRLAGEIALYVSEVRMLLIVAVDLKRHLDDDILLTHSHERIEAALKELKKYKLTQEEVALILLILNKLVAWEVKLTDSEAKKLTEFV